MAGCRPHHGVEAVYFSDHAAFAGSPRRYNGTRKFSAARPLKKRRALRCGGRYRRRRAPRHDRRDVHSQVVRARVDIAAPSAIRQNLIEEPLESCATGGSLARTRRSWVVSERSQPRPRHVAAAASRGSSPPGRALRQQPACARRAAGDPRHSRFCLGPRSRPRSARRH